MLTNRQQATYRFIHDYHVRRGRAPKLTEIADGIGIRSKGVVHRYLKALSEAGLIELERGQHPGHQTDRPIRRRRINSPYAATGWQNCCGATHRGHP